MSLTIDQIPYDETSASSCVPNCLKKIPSSFLKYRMKNADIELVT
jgi:hypothetical protein